MTNYTSGTTYTKGKIDVRNEMIPNNPAFRSYKGEGHYFDSRETEVSFGDAAKAFFEGETSGFDRIVLSLIATFGAGISSKALKEMLTMMDVSYSDNTFDSCLKRLHRLNLINFSHFAVEGKPAAKMRIITLAYSGSIIARSIGVEHYFSQKDYGNVEAYKVKARVQTAHLISNYLKRGLVDSFEVRPVLMKNPSLGEIVRPAASITVGGEKIFFEVPRRRDGWLEDLTEKLVRYERVFANKPTPTVILCGEDEGMNREIAKAIEYRGYALEILYTNDLAMFGDGFRYSLYDFNGTAKRCYEFVTPDKIGA